MKCTHALLLAAGLAATGCDRPDPLDAPPLNLAMAMSIGAIDDSAYAFNRIAGVVVAGDGRLYVADGGDSRIRVYTRHGQHVRDIGKEGAGPGEFLGIMATGLVGDTLYVIDRQAGRITFFDSTGALIGSRRAAHGSFTEGSTVTLPYRLLPGGRELSTALSRSDSDGGTALLLTRGGELVDTLLAAAGTGLKFEIPGGRLFLDNPFAKPVPFPVSDNGVYAAWIESSPDGGMAPGEFRIRVGRIGGEMVWERRFRDAPVAYRQSKADSLIEARLRVLPPGLITARQLREAASPPQFEWPVQAAYMADDGRLFVRRPSAGEAGEWFIIGSSGAPEGRFSLPASARPLSARGDTLLVHETDALDVPRIVEYHIRRARK